VTRSSELKRIEDALEHADIHELQWAASACRLRLRFVTKKNGGPCWRSLLSRIEAVLLNAGAELNAPLSFSSATSKRNRAERHQPGKPTGHFRCVLKRPSLDVDQDIRFSGDDPFRKLRRFLRDYLPDGAVGDENTSFTFSAVVRHRSNQGVRNIVLCRWRTGQSVTAALDRAAERWKALQKKAE
jgi:hypothetical protein